MYFFLDESGIDRGKAVLCLIFIPETIDYSNIQKKLTWKKKCYLSPALKLVYEQSKNPEFKFHSYMKALDHQDEKVKSEIKQHLKSKLAELCEEKFGVVYVSANLDRWAPGDRLVLVQLLARLLLHYTFVYLGEPKIATRNFSICADKGFYRYAKLRTVITKVRDNIWQCRVFRTDQSLSLSSSERVLLDKDVQSKHSHLEKGLQLADLVAGAIRQTFNGEMEYYQLIKKRIKMSIDGDKIKDKTLQHSYVDLKKLQKEDKLRMY